MSTDKVPLSGSLVGEIREEVAAAERDWHSALAHAMRAGDLLIEAKAQLKHGEWLPWLAANFEMTPQTANGYMRAARNRTQIEGNPSISTIEGALDLVAMTTTTPSQPALVGGNAEPSLKEEWDASDAAEEELAAQAARLRFRIERRLERGDVPAGERLELAKKYIDLGDKLTGGVPPWEAQGGE
jgi:hypothetical protein